MDVFVYVCVSIEYMERVVKKSRGVQVGGIVGGCVVMLLLVAKRETMRVIQIPLNGGRRLIGINKKDRRRRRVKKNLHKLKNIYTPPPSYPIGRSKPGPGSYPWFFPSLSFREKFNRVKSPRQFFSLVIASALNPAAQNDVEIV